jgi:hypothetical protein
MSGECWADSIITTPIANSRECALIEWPLIGLGMQQGSKSPCHVFLPLSVCCMALAVLAAC